MANDAENDDSISRTQKKHQAEAIQDIGERLLGVSTKQLKTLDLPENLFDAVQLAKKIRAHGGRKRQLQFIGKLMRHTDTGKIESYFEILDSKHYANDAKFKHMEVWRDRLVEEGNDAVQAFQLAYSEVDVQQLRQLVRNAKNTKNEKLALKSKRAIFQCIKEVIMNHSSA